MEWEVSKEVTSERIDGLGHDVGTTGLLTPAPTETRFRDARPPQGRLHSLTHPPSGTEGPSF